MPDYPITIDQQNASTGNELYSVAPGENKHPIIICDGQKVRRIGNYFFVS